MGIQNISCQLRLVATQNSKFDHQDFRVFGMTSFNQKTDSGCLWMAPQERPWKRYEATGGETSCRVPSRRGSCTACALLLLLLLRSSSSPLFIMTYPRARPRDDGIQLHAVACVAAGRTLSSSTLLCSPLALPDDDDGVMSAISVF